MPIKKPLAGLFHDNGITLTKGDGAELPPTQYTVDSTAHLILFELLAK